MKRSPVFVAVFLSLVVCLSVYAASTIPQKSDGSVKLTSSNTEQKVVVNGPVEVRGEITTKVDPEEAKHRSEEFKSKEESDVSIVRYTLLLAVSTFLLFLFTAALWWVTYRLGKEAKRTSDKQFAGMDRSIQESMRSANAIEGIAIATRQNSELLQSFMAKQLRAYIAVEVGTPTYQSEALRFAAAPVMVNTGYTPARNVSHKIQCDILDVPRDFQFDETTEWLRADAVLAPRQTFVMNKALDRRVPDGELEGIMAGRTGRLFVWGTIAYEDIFGNPWETKFCHNFVFYRDSQNNIRPIGYYFASHNSAT